MLDLSHLLSLLTPLNLLILVLLLTTYHLTLRLLHLKIPGPTLYALTKWRLAYTDYTGTRTPTIHSLHLKYGSAIRIGPNELSFTSLSALRTIYGAGSGFERTSFYRMFDVYGYQNLFTFSFSKMHSERKKLLANVYSKSSILKTTAKTVEKKVWEFMQLLEREPEIASEIFSSLHYYSLDNITHFLYGSQFGGTSAMNGNLEHRNMISDILNPARRKLAWFATHVPRYTKFVMSLTGFPEIIVNKLNLLPMRKPTTYTGIRRHALTAFQTFLSSPPETKAEMKDTTIIGRLWTHHISQKPQGGGLQNLEIASECADHLLAGIDTTSDTLLFLIWALSLPPNLPFQAKLIKEVSSLSSSSLDSRGIPTVEATGKLQYLDAIIKETLRLYAPLPASEPRVCGVDTLIDGYRVPKGTVVSMAPFSLHRNPEVFREPLRFDPERWLRDEEEVGEMRKWWWAFSSGGRMCIGLHLAMAEMTTLVAAIYRSYRTTVKAGTEDTTPGITSRFEVFRDETMAKMKKHECWIDFEKQ